VSSVTSVIFVSFRVHPRAPKEPFTHSLRCVLMRGASETHEAFLPAQSSYIIFFIQLGDNIQTARQLRNAVFY